MITKKRTQVIQNERYGFVAQNTREQNTKDLLAKTNDTFHEWNTSNKAEQTKESCLKTIPRVMEPLTGRKTDHRKAKDLSERRLMGKQIQTRGK